jgi:hypothetical protein
MTWCIAVHLVHFRASVFCALQHHVCAFEVKGTQMVAHMPWHGKDAYASVECSSHV